MIKKDMIRLEKSLRLLKKAEETLSDALDSIDSHDTEYITYMDRARSRVSVYRTVVETYREIKNQREGLERIIRLFNEQLAVWNKK